MVQIENTDFDIFDANSKENWEAIMELFRKEVHKLELEGVNFIDQSFKMIRSSEAALAMLLKFKHIETRQLIQNKMMLKFDVILDQYMKELLAVEDHFTVNKNLLKYHKIHIINVFRGISDIRFYVETCHLTAVPSTGYDFYILN